MLMRVSNLSVAYGPHSALDDVSIDVDAGEIVSIIGANGAGKSTLLRTVAGILKPLSATIIFQGKEHHAAEAGQDREDRACPWSPKDAASFPTLR